MKEIFIKDWVNMYLAGYFEKSDESTQREAGWISWFCSGKTLHRRLKYLSNNILKLIAIINLSKNKFLNISTTKIRFKNYASTDGSFIDRIIFCDKDDIPLYYIESMKEKNVCIFVKSDIVNGDSVDTEIFRGTWDGLCDVVKNMK